MHGVLPSSATHEAQLKAMGNTEYHSHQGYLSSSSIGLFLRSPRLFGMWLNGQYRRDATKSLRIGSALDAILTGTQGEISVRPDVDRRTKAGKATYAEWLETLGDRQEVSQDEYRTAMDMAESVDRHPCAQVLLEKVVDSQAAIFLEGQVTRWKVKFDGILDNCGILEVKTHAAFDREANHEYEFAKTCMKWGWHRQAWLYRRAQAVLHKCEDFQIQHTFLCVSNAEPYDVHVYQLDEEFMQLGGREISGAAGDIVARMETNYWGLDSSDKCSLIGAPEWALKNETKR